MHRRAELLQSAGGVPFSGVQSGEQQHTPGVAAAVDLEVESGANQVTDAAADLGVPVGVQFGDWFVTDQPGSG